jgi:hypothetical protein
MKMLFSLLLLVGTMAGQTTWTWTFGPAVVHSLRNAILKDGSNSFWESSSAASHFADLGLPEGQFYCTNSVAYQVPANPGLNDPTTLTGTCSGTDIHGTPFSMTYVVKGYQIKLGNYIEWQITSARVTVTETP